ncbi:hypothetical protein DDB_G0292498 [Dictyostelium discoideum AX4]|uniref:Putative uncharacterized protein DDB_G0292498 n=2 Tax=Dictyostelium TaxID=5782 RepID=Y4436_DICDI|nr:hypothetical protein DDB_G0292498 [Dictyostelium discoideum AX4]Q54D37.1 RecName: Full=Putative uncharacterized protein DDB_G0292498 [Dictyostelium discoideum]EAL61228.1 hypothetical protein DDB_G0292498 [Dictyostelium discoideum AX4]|eukprot:XP_629659.1 hypothetical protein DDB_G0292498 [Dictyostelium discoideum AX4]
MDSISVPLQFCLMRVQEAVPGKPHFSVERLLIRVTYSDERISHPIGNPEA